MTPWLYSRGGHIGDVHPEPRRARDWGEFIEQLDRDRAARKEGAPYICAPFNGDGRRCAEGAQPCAWIALDLDRVAPDSLADVRLWFARWRGVAWPTHSSRPDAPRERVIVALDRDVSRDERIAIGRVLARDLGDEFGEAVLLDDSTFRPEQPLFVPPAGVTLARFDGEPLRVDAYLDAARDLPRDAREMGAVADTKGTVAPGARNKTLTRLAGHLRRAGLDADAIEAALRAHNAAHCDPPLGDDEVASVALSIGRYPAGIAAKYEDRLEERCLSPTKGSVQVASDSLPSEDWFALAFVEAHGAMYRYVAPWHRWLKWDGKRWREDSTGHVYERIRELVRAAVEGDKAERSTANASFVSGVERLAHTDQRVVVLPEQLDADPWLLNTQSGIVDLRTGVVRPHNPGALCRRITGAAVDPDQGGELWREFIDDITLGDVELAGYLQRLAGYCATGTTTEDMLGYLFGIGANGKSSFAESIEHSLGDYARTFSPEVLMEAKGERHPTDLAQFMGVRVALTSEPGSGAAWNDSRVKSLTGDKTISARFMRGDFFTFQRTHKTIVVGNHMPRLADVTHAMQRRLQVIPFRAVFQPGPGIGMRERLKAEASGAILAWIVEGARRWLAQGTAPPASVRNLTADYLGDQDVIGQWLNERCERDTKALELLGDLHRNYSAWCETQGFRPRSNLALSAHLVGAGFEKKATMVGKVFHGLRLRASGVPQ